MSKPRRELNPRLTAGDRVMCLHMDGETSVPPMTLGTVRSVVRDPFEDDAEIINVAWDNGNSLGLLSVTDRWVKAPQEQIEESSSPQNQYDFLSKNPDVFGTKLPFESLGVAVSSPRENLQRWSRSLSGS